MNLANAEDPGGRSRWTNRAQQQGQQTAERMQHEHSHSAAAASSSSQPSLDLLAADAASADASRSYDGSSSCSRSSESPANDEGNDAWSPRLFEADPLMQQPQQQHHDPARLQTAAAGQPLFAHGHHGGASGSALTRPPQMRSVSTPLIVPAIQLPVPLSRRLLGGGHHSPLPPHHDGPSPLERDAHTPMQHPQQHAQQLQLQQQLALQHQLSSSPQLVKIAERFKRESPITLAVAAVSKPAAFSPYTSAASSAAASTAGSPARSKKKKSSQKKKLFGEELERSNEIKAKQARELRARKGAYLAALEDRIAQQQQFIALMHAHNTNVPMDGTALLPPGVSSELARLALLPPLVSPYTHQRRTSPRRQTPSSTDSIEAPVQALVLSPSMMRSRRSSVVTPSSFRSSVPSPASVAAAGSSSHPSTPSQNVSRLTLANNRRSVPSALDQPPISPSHLSHSASPDAPRISSSSQSHRSMSMDQLYSLPEQAGNWAMSDHGHEVAAAGGGGGVFSPHQHQMPPPQAHWHQSARPSSAYQQAAFMLPDAALQSRIVSAPHAQHNMAADHAASSGAAAASAGSMTDTPPSTGATSSRVRSRTETPYVANDASPHKRGRLEDERGSPAMRHEAHRPQGVPHVMPLRPGSSTPIDVMQRPLGRQLSSNDSVSDLAQQLSISTPPQSGDIAQSQQLPVLASPPAAATTWMDGAAPGMINWPSTCGSVAHPFVFSSSASNFGTSLNQLSISSSPPPAAATSSSAPPPLRRLQDAEPTQQSIFSASADAALSSPQPRARQG